MTPPMPRAVVALLVWVVPGRHLADVLAELGSDYARIRRRQWRVIADGWLVWEAVKLTVAFALAAPGRLRSVAPLWYRDAQLMTRGLRRAPVAMLGAAATLAIGFLAVMITVGLTETLLLRPVSSTYGFELRRLATVDARGGDGYRLSFVELEVIREHVGDAGRISSANLQPVVLRADGADTQTMIEAVDGAYFDLVGTRMVAGRGLMATDDRAAAPPVAVVSEALWHRRFGADRSLLGRAIRVNGAAFTVVGIIAASGSASVIGSGVDAWTPLAHADAVLNPGWRTDQDARWFAGFVLPARSVAEIDARLAAAAAELARRQPERWRDRTLVARDGSVLVGRDRARVTTLLWTLGGLSLLILGAGAAGVGGALTARAAAARVQTAIHLSMGAGRVAVARRLVFEGAALGWIGGALALGLYVWMRRYLEEVALLPTLSFRLDLPLSTAGLAAAWVAAVVAGALLAVAPAVRASTIDTVAALAGGSRSVIGARSRTRRLLVSAQVAVSTVRVVGAALFSRSLESLAAEDVGFPRAGLVAMDFDLEPTGPAVEGRGRLAREVLRRTAAVPGVLATAMSNRAPIDPSTPTVAVRPGRGAALVGDVSVNLVTEGYFVTVGLPLVAGRAFTQEECDRGADVVVVNETLVGALWPGDDAVGRSLVVGTDQRELRVIGVARDSKYRSMAETGRMHLYRPTPPGFGATLLARGAGDPREALLALQAALDGVGPGVTGFFPRTLDDHLEIELLPTRAAAAAASLLGSLALLLSAAGLYGLVAWTVEQRHREIGVRIALGARPVDLVRLVVAEACASVGPGVLAGVLLAAGLAAAVRTGLHGIAPLDPVSFGIAVVALLAVVGVASWVPSRRAARVDPAVALRHV
ncbi:MAG: ABC transporter permease [Vicinamibacterales bacterium]